MALVRGDAISTQEYLCLDDSVLETMLARFTEHADSVVAQLAGRLRNRRLFKTLSLRSDVNAEEAQMALEQAVRASDFDPKYFASLDRVEVQAYEEDESLMVRYGGGRLQRLLDVSPVMQGLNQANFIQTRAVFPGEVRREVTDAMTRFV